MATFLQIGLSSLLAVSVLLMDASPSHSDQRNLVQLDPREVTVNGITILSTETEILHIIGKPQKVEIGFDEPTAERSKTFHYEGVRIYLIGSKIYNLSCKGRSCQTGKGIRIGDEKEKVIAAYGTYGGDSGTSISYMFKGLDSSFVFHIENGLVDAIEFFVDYV